jgi:hypothetical protein
MPVTNRLRTAVADLDQVLRARLVEPDELRHLVQRRSDHGIVLARQAVALADPRAESPPESELRVLLTLAGLSPVPQFEVWDDLGFVARVDLGFPGSRVAVEYDGAWHATAEQTAKDHARLARLHSCGWQVVTVTAELLRTGSPEIIRQVQTALCEGGARRIQRA